MAREFADWAVHQLEKDQDSKNVRILASEFNAKELADVEDRFRRSLNELNWEFPTSVSAVERYSRHLISQIAKGEIMPYDGCKNLNEIYFFLDCPRNLSNWSCLFWAEDEISDDQLDELIVDEAMKIVAGESSELIEKGYLSFSDVGKPRNFWSLLRKKFF